jgi:hypothetical protein
MRLIKHSDESVDRLSHDGSDYEAIEGGVFLVPDHVADALLGFPHWSEHFEELGKAGQRRVAALAESLESKDDVEDLEEVDDPGALEETEDELGEHEADGDAEEKVGHEHQVGEVVDIRSDVARAVLPDASAPKAAEKPRATRTVRRRPRKDS